MLKELLSLCIVLLILAASPIVFAGNSEARSLATESQLNQQISSEELDQFRQLLIDYYSAWSISEDRPWDISGAERFYQQSDRLFGFDLMPPAEGFQGWEAYKAELTKIMSNFKTWTVTLGDRFLVYCNGEVMWMISTFNTAGSLQDGTPVTSSGRNTLVLERLNNQWLIAHEHVSTPFVSPAN